jgi:hypothetical protein
MTFVLSCCVDATACSELWRIEPALSPRFIDRDSHGIAQVEAALVRQHGQAQALFGGESGHDFGWQAAGFAAKDENVVIV